jgi:3-hydroxyisobutyrate dehydrogenase
MGTQKIGFVGIGNMGWPMAANLCRAGFDVAVTDARPGRAEAFVAQVGGRAAAGAGEAATGADVLVTMLPTSTHVGEVLRDALPVLRRGTVVADMSSGVPSTTRALAAACGDHGVDMVDCPVSGGVPRAITGDLAAMAGGDPHVLERLAPVLGAMASSIHHCGPTGAGQAMKALNNLVSAGGFLVGVEALVIGRRFGLEPARMVEVLNASSGANNSTQRKFAQFVLSGTFDSGFGLDLMAKDLAIATEIALDGGVVAPFSTLCAQLWADAAATLGPGHDHTEMARFVEAVAGREVA